VVAQVNHFGIGVITGEPLGITMKLWTSDINAFDVGLGWSMGGDQIGVNNQYYYGGNRVHLHTDFLWHAFDAFNSAEPYALFYGFGARLNGGNGSVPSLAIRVVSGIAWLPGEAPIDLFLELVPLLQLTPSRGFGIDAGVGARYFF
jgi:hypothetical protein